MVEIWDIRGEDDYYEAVRNACVWAAEKRDWYVQSDQFYKGYVSGMADIIYAGFDAGDDDPSEILDFIVDQAEKLYTIKKEEKDIWLYDYVDFSTFDPANID